MASVIRAQGEQAHREHRAWKIVGLRADQLAHLRRITKYSGEDGAAFFESAVWWWRPLLRIIGPRAHAIELPPTSQRGFFPAFVFSELRASEAGGGLHDILSSWFANELAARLDGAYANWPAFMIDTSNVRMPEWDELHKVLLPERMIDLRRTDTELLNEFKADLQRLRAYRRENAGFPVDDKIRKSSYLSEHTFAVIELIDRRLSLSQHVSEDAWANVNKAVRQRARYIFPKNLFR